MPSLDALLIVVLVAFAAPFLLGLAPGLRVPAVVLEIVAGIVVGPSVLGWVEIDQTTDVLATLGLAFLLFLGGLEVDLERLRGPVLRLAGSGYALSLAIAVAVSLALGAGGLVDTPLLVAIALGSTSLGVLIPVLKDSGRVESALGQLVIAGGSIADFAAIILLSLFFAGEGGPGATLVLIGALFGLALVVLAAVRGAQRSLRIRADLLRLQDTTAQIRVRGALVLLVGFAAAAQQLGLEVILGTFAAGAMLSAADPDRAMTHPDFRRKLDAIGFGVFIPIFFVTSGIRFDLDALTGSASALAMMPLFLAALLVVRGIPALSYRDLLDRREVLVAGLMQATSLPFLVAATAIGRELELIGAGEGAALVGAGLLSVLLFPAAGLALLRRHPKPKGSAMQTTCSSYATDAEAAVAVRQMLADGMAGTRISVISGRMAQDHRVERVGAYAGEAVTVGGYAGMTGSTADAMGGFGRGTGEERRGSFGDIDRDEIATYENGVRRVHVASHRELAKRLAEAGLDADAVAADVAAVHDGRVLVLVTAA
ncbi:MAG TPA: cation:proton antiporter [Solirubrobacteraceae bacterium]|nr:cation:proton antiporter [Solirubrobacteraceae bacterium]